MHCRLRHLAPHISDGQHDARNKNSNRMQATEASLERLWMQFSDAE